MLKIFNDLRPFFEDCYNRINVREYSKIIEVSPPTASTLLNYYKKEGLLLMKEYRNNLLYYANKDNKYFIHLSRLYWNYKMEELFLYLEENLINPTLVLFGSLSKAEAKVDSDIDLAIFSIKKNIDFQKFEKIYKRKIQIFWFKSINDIKDIELSNNIINGYVIVGKLEWTGKNV